MNNRVTIVCVALIAAAMVLSTAAPASAKVIGKDAKFGVGLGGGALTSGLTAKMYLSDSTAVQAVAGITGWGVSFGADFIKEFGSLFDHRLGTLKWGVGGGAGVVLYSVGTYSSTIIGISGVVQLSWHFKSFPLEIVTDWRPTYFIGDYIGGVYLGGGGGAIRYYF